MLISFDNKKIRAICEEEEVALKNFEMQVVIKLQSRLADISAANYVTDIFFGNPKEIKNIPYPNYKIDLCGGYILIFAANNVIIQELENGNIDWSKVSRIKILEIKEQNG